MKRRKVFEAMRRSRRDDVVARPVTMDIAKKRTWRKNSRRGDLLRHEIIYRFMAMGGSAVVSAFRQVSSGHRYRSAGGTETRSAKAFRGFGAADGAVELHSLRLSPNSAVAIAARVKLAGEEFIGQQKEL